MTRNMKRLILCSLLVLALLPASAQGRIETKKFKIADFPAKTTKIVLTGNDVVDEAFRKEITERWNISPFEFCTPQEFTSLQGSNLYYFLTFANGPAGPEGEAGLTFLTLVKGGTKAEKGLAGMLEVISVPFAPSGAPSTRSFLFLPALIDIIQDFIPKAIQKDRTGYAGLSSYNKNLSKAQGRRILLSRNDLSGKLDDDQIANCLNPRFFVVDEETADRAFADAEQETLVGYLIAPFAPSQGALTYKMLIDAETHELYYFKREKAGKDGDAGFSADELKKFSNLNK